MQVRATKKIEPPKDSLRDAFLPAEGEERMRWIAAARDFAQADREIEALQARINQLTVSRDEAKKKLIGTTETMPWRTSPVSPSPVLGQATRCTTPNS